MNISIHCNNIKTPRMPVSLRSGFGAARAQCSKPAAVCAVVQKFKAATRAVHYFIPDGEGHHWPKFEEALKDARPLGDVKCRDGLPFPKLLHKYNLKHPKYWTWGSSSSCVVTVGDLVHMLVRVAFERLRREYRAPYVEACNGDSAEAALLWVRKPLRWASSQQATDVATRHEESRNVCTIVRASVRRDDNGYAMVHLGGGRGGRPIVVRLHNMLTHLLHGHPPRPVRRGIVKDCAVHQDECHHAGHGDNQALIRSPPCRSLLCINPAHLPGWESRSQNAYDGSLGETVKMKHLRHPPVAL